ncbi:hypothetical protein BJX68DRAFT_45949 [Aspergillus pseudodeflectus]|uniref:Uncharacterized protein n=1 Tax=Aspergillus pseudodeflectus TaxID=176178 RepID=A0ABR4KN52_9EURO
MCSHLGRMPKQPEYGVQPPICSSYWQSFLFHFWKNDINPNCRASEGYRIPSPRSTLRVPSGRGSRPHKLWGIQTGANLSLRVKQVKSPNSPIRLSDPPVRIRQAYDHYELAYIFRVLLVAPAFAAKLLDMDMIFRHHGSDSNSHHRRLS